MHANHVPDFDTNPIANTVCFSYNVSFAVFNFVADDFVISDSNIEPNGDILTDANTEQHADDISETIWNSITDDKSDANSFVVYESGTDI